MLKLTINRVCEHCGANFTAKTTTTRFCSDSCAKRAYKRRKRQECIEMCSGRASQQLQDELEKRYPEIMSPRLAGQYLGVHFTTIYRYMRAEVLKAAQLPGKTLVRKSDLDSLFVSSDGYKVHQKTGSASPKEYTTVKVYTLEKEKTAKDTIMVFNQPITSEKVKEALCENIVSYRDVTHIVLSLRNRSSVSYSIADATFVLESKRKGKRTVAFEKGLTPKNRHGSLSADADGVTRMAYSFDKMTLTDDQVLKVYLYEEGGQRNLVMTVSAKDINKAKATRKQRTLRKFISP